LPVAEELTLTILLHCSEDKIPLRSRRPSSVTPCGDEVVTIKNEKQAVVGVDAVGRAHVSYRFDPEVPLYQALVVWAVVAGAAELL
jgi:hypothetical protein